MATLQQVGAVVHGFPYDLRWTDFAKRKISPSPPSQAFASSSYNLTGGRVALINEAYVVSGASILVSISKTLSWSVTSSQTATLLNHEQGHFDITGLIARDLARKVLDLSLPVADLANVKEAGTSPEQHEAYARNQFQKSMNAFAREAATLMNQLQSNTRGRDGAYDDGTSHGQNQAEQDKWDAFFRQMKTSVDDLGRALAISGLI